MDLEDSLFPSFPATCRRTKAEGTFRECRHVPFPKQLQLPFFHVGKAPVHRRLLYKHGGAEPPRHPIHTRSPLEFHCFPPQRATSGVSGFFFPAGNIGGAAAPRPTSGSVLPVPATRAVPLRDLGVSLKKGGTRETRSLRVPKKEGTRRTRSLRVPLPPIPLVPLSGLGSGTRRGHAGHRGGSERCRNPGTRSSAGMLRPRGGRVPGGLSRCPEGYPGVPEGKDMDYRPA